MGTRHSVRLQSPFPRICAKEEIIELLRDLVLNNAMGSAYEKRALQYNEDHYKILEVDYDATDETIRSNYIRLAMKWHPDKRKDEESATTRFQEINEAYQVLSDPVKREEYDRNGIPRSQDYYMMEYLHRFEGLILTCNGLGIRHSIW